jgi:hypothetical protein
MSDVPSGARWFGTPAMPAREFMKSFARLRKLGRGGGKSEGDE